MKDITRILVFDFDETLFRMPGYTDRFSVERLNPDLNFPTPYSFYDHPASMDPEIHNIQIVGPVYEDWREASNDPSARTILITHRTEELRPYAEHLLKMHGIVFDEMYFLGRVSEKIIVLEKELSQLPSIKEITGCEHSLEQLGKYQDFFYKHITPAYRSMTALSEIPMLRMQFVDKSKVIDLYEFTIGESRRIILG